MPNRREEGKAIAVLERGISLHADYSASSFHVSPTHCQGRSNIEQRSQTYILQSECAVWTARNGVQTASLFLKNIY